MSVSPSPTTPPPTNLATPAPARGILLLQDFLQLPYLDDSPAWEYVEGVATQKPMPKTRHSLLQKRLLGSIDLASETHTALPELRCTFGGRSTVPDIAVIAWSRIPITEAGEPEDNFDAAPDWTLEILSPQQSATRIIDNILHALQHGCQLGWMLDPDDHAIFVLRPNQAPEVYRDDRPLPVLPDLNLALTAAEVFGWLQIRRS